MQIAGNSCRLGLRDEAFALGAFAGQFACTAHSLGLPTRLGFGRLLESRAGLHFPEDAFALHLLLERLQRLIDVVIADHDLNYLKLSIGFPAGPGGIGLERKKRRKGQNRPLLRMRVARSTGDLSPPSTWSVTGRRRSDTI
jgi:hypothetical protein